MLKKRYQENNWAGRGRVESAVINPAIKTCGIDYSLCDLLVENQDRIFTREMHESTSQLITKQFYLSQLDQLLSNYPQPLVWKCTLLKNGIQFEPSE